MGTLHEFPEAGHDGDADERGATFAFGFILFVLWVFSVARVVIAAEMREVFGVEASLAFICMVALPFGAVRAWLQRPRRRARASQQPQSGIVVALRPRVARGRRVARSNSGRSPV